jgi:hypothetical protein
MDQEDLGRPPLPTELCDYVGLAAASVGCFRENLLVQELHAPEVDTLFDVWIEELQEILEKGIQELLETLIVAQFFSSRRRRREKRLDAPSPPTR